MSELPITTGTMAITLIKDSQQKKSKNLYNN